MVKHGIKVNELTVGARTIAAVTTSIIGLVVTSGTTGDAQAVADLDAAFPLDTPVLVTNINQAIADSGDEGTLRPTLEAIADQASPVLVIVRVAEGADAAATEANVVGTYTDGDGSGLKALRAAEAKVGVRPRILAAPGLDTQAVVNEGIIVAQKLRAMFYAAAIGDDAAAAITYRGNFTARELMLIWPGSTEAFAGDLIARAVGLRSRIDEDQGWHKTLSNVAFQGITGISKDVDFDLVDESTTASTLNAGQVTTVIRQTGFRFWGNRTAADINAEPEFSFESAVRTSQVLQDEIAQGLFGFIDKPLTQQLVRDIIETINARFRSLKARGYIIDGVAEYRADSNSEGDLAGGKLVIDYEFTPTAPLEHLTLNQRITDRFYADFAQDLAA